MVRLIIARQKLHNLEGSLELIHTLRKLDEKLKAGANDPKKQTDEAPVKLKKVPLLTLDMLEGTILVEQNQFAKAIDLFSRVEKEMPFSARVNIQKGRALCLGLKVKEAITEYKKALQKDVDSPTAWTGIARCQFILKNYEETVDACLKAIGLTYFFPNAHYYLGMSLFHLEEYEHAANALEVCLSQNQHIGKARNLLIRIYEKHLNSEEKASLHRSFFQNQQGEAVIVVSGIPRSGTSLMMQILEANNIEIFTDSVRKADQHNPKGYYEHEKVKQLARDKSWLNQTVGKAVKIISQLLFHLPEYHQYKVIFMTRNLKEVIHSQRTMLREEKKSNEKDVYPAGLENAYKRNIRIVEQWAANRTNIEIEWVDYHDLLSLNDEIISRIGSFIGKPVDKERVAACLDNELYRSKL
jgi:tetratricopeptide (TPR) repeat protein